MHGADIYGLRFSSVYSDLQKAYEANACTWRSRNELHVVSETHFRHMSQVLFQYTLPRQGVDHFQEMKEKRLSTLASRV